ncbi:SAM-dependent methyltransferase [Shewanella woodyi]|uniref:Uroporphyrin-III C/tetrapyrrole (Corrin/Porphyrin) methyltransferase n=1 Tax=Shewanella woodyi (strain ATCC 51908 / MS32) TaxID=392500 RepID=B1KKH2_SHEWM|nr:SAM-dependent methyltransferase [Shewanella woodyi]ACA85812.1 Uroporphyrin-III C/tetrapyrrole (Corrin/Porphyrin) methyltransferase [Shewanella woodyi ATCC 51908]
MGMVAGKITIEDSCLSSGVREVNGSLVCVGTGLNLAGQISVLSKSYIENADVVFSLVPDGFAQRWLETLNNDVRSLQPFYAQGDEIKNRRDTYDQMVEAILEQVRAGKRVVCALYGHPGVFACVSHFAIAQALDEGYSAKMEPGISAEACLWADLGIDPGQSGHQSFEASQFMFYKHTPDPTTHLLLWQIGIAGEHTLTEFHTSSDRLQILVEQLNEWYPLEHEITIYEAPTLPIHQARVDKLLLRDLPFARLTSISTLLIPPSSKLEVNHAILGKLGITEVDLG